MDQYDEDGQYKSCAGADFSGQVDELTGFCYRQKKCTVLRKRG